MRFTAAMARLRTNVVLGEIEHKIGIAADEGRNQLQIEGQLSPKNKLELEDAGYGVTYDTLFTIISWKDE